MECNRWSDAKKQSGETLAAEILDYVRFPELNRPTHSDYRLHPGTR